jgi:hypothetical protein|tara:strand:- start:798 stop:1241 length:444 start_codon:yes stop_codon:yes gene_type:complete
MEATEKINTKMGRPPITDPDYNLARARKMEADAELTELELLKAKGELVPTDEVKNEWINALSSMRAKLLSLPTITAPLVSNETDVSIIQDIIEKQIHEALNELSNYTPTKQARSEKSSSGSNGSTEATTKIKNKSMGRPRKAAIIRS